MKISWIKEENEKKVFNIPELFGLDVYKISSYEEIDNKISELIKKNYDTFIISNDVAGFSQDIIKKYRNDSSVNIIINKRKV